MAAEAAAVERHLEALLVDVVDEMRIEAVETRGDIIAEPGLKRSRAAEAFELVGFEPGLHTVHALGAAWIAAISPCVPVAGLVRLIGVGRRKCEPNRIVGELIHVRAERTVPFVL